jgi:WD40 repeat protein
VRCSIPDTTGIPGGSCIPTWSFPLALNANGSVLASGDFHGCVRIWQMPGHIGPTILQAPVTPHSRLTRITALAFSPDGEILTTASADGTLRLWPWCALVDA